MVVSSANKINLSIFEQFAISLTHNKNRRGPNIEPCGTPTEIYLNFSPLVTNCFLSVS